MVKKLTKRSAGEGKMVLIVVGSWELSVLLSKAINDSFFLSGQKGEIVTVILKQSGRIIENEALFADIEWDNIFLDADIPGFPAGRILLLINHTKTKPVIVSSYAEVRGLTEKAGYKSIEKPPRKEKMTK